MQGIRERYQAARDEAGNDFVEKNPGEHFFFSDGIARPCAFCGASEEGAKAHAPEGREFTTCPGDVRGQRAAARRAAAAADVERNAVAKPAPEPRISGKGSLGRQ